MPQDENPVEVCDCQNPPPSPDAEGIFHVSEDCPIHGPIEGFVPMTATPAPLHIQRGKMRTITIPAEGAHKTCAETALQIQEAANPVAVCGELHSVMSRLYRAEPTTNYRDLVYHPAVVLIFNKLKSMLPDTDDMYPAAAGQAQLLKDGEAARVEW